MKTVKASIVGCGKMGQEIMNIFLDSDIEIVWLGRNLEKIEECNQIIRKRLKRIARKNGWSKEQLELRQSQIVVSFDDKDLCGSNLVIETIVENLEEKQKMFARIEQLVTDTCILLTNTSSLPLTRVFEKMKNRTRCAGLHFFYPCTMIPTVEINYISETKQEYILYVENMMQELGRNYIRLSEKVNMLFSKLIFILMSEAYNIFSENVVEYEQINQLSKDKFMMMGIFDILNSTGNRIVFNCVENFIEPQNEKFFEKFKKLIYDIHFNYHDCSFLEYCSYVGQEKEIKPNLQYANEDYLQRQLYRFECLYLNYVTYLVNNGFVDSKELICACRDILGIVKTPRELLSELGEELVTKILQEELDLFPSEMFQKTDFSVWNSEV